MFHKMISLCVMIGVLLSVHPAIMAQELTSIEQELMESLGKCCSPEKQAWYEQQYEIYIKEHPVAPLIRHEHFTAYKGSPVRRNNSSVDRILLLINSDLYSNQTAKEKIDRYAQDVGNGHGCQVEMEVLEGGSAEEIKELIKSYYTDGGLDGVVQFGGLQPAWFFDADPQYGGNFTCDLFFQDMDGTWQDKNSNGKYDAHDHGSGDRAPEIFYGRIDPATMGQFGTEVELLSFYLDKNHRYWTNQIPLKKSAFVQIEPDWQNATNYVDKIYGTGNTEIIRGTGSRNDYLNNRLTKDYSFLHLWCHSGHTAHSFSSGGGLNYTTIHDAKPKPIGYAHDGCHCADWAAGNGSGFTVGGYVYNESETALVAISGTKTGQWIGYKGERFFEELGKNTCVGEAYVLWFEPYINNATDMDYFILWDYGYCIIGDPMMCFIEVTNNVEISQDNVLSNKSGYSCKFTNKNNVKISYSLASSELVSIRLYTTTGKRVATLVNAFQNQGQHSVNFSAGKVANGLYVLGLNAGSYTVSKKIKVVH